jgi:cytoskeletal protein RodZ
MKVMIASAIIAAGLILAATSNAQAPAGSTGACKDGTYTSAESKRGACRGHGGVKTWYAENKSEAKAEKKSEAKAAEKKAASTTATQPAAAPAPAAAAPKTSTTTSTATKKAPEGMRAEAAPGGGAGKVWVNTSSHVYHCIGDEWYGKTKAGEYMSEAEAKAKGARAARNKACS